MAKATAFFCMRGIRAYLCSLLLLATTALASPLDWIKCAFGVGTLSAPTPLPPLVDIPRDSQRQMVAQKELLPPPKQRVIQNWGGINKYLRSERTGEEVFVGARTVIRGKVLYLTDISIKRVDANDFKPANGTQVGPAQLREFMRQVADEARGLGFEAIVFKSERTTGARQRAGKEDRTLVQVMDLTTPEPKEDSDPPQ